MRERVCVLSLEKKANNVNHAFLPTPTLPRPLFPPKRDDCLSFFLSRLSRAMRSHVTLDFGTSDPVSKSISLLSNCYVKEIWKMIIGHPVIGTD